MSADLRPEPSGTWPKAVPLLVLAGLLAYCNSFTKAFVIDDIAWIPRHPDIGDFWRYLEGPRWAVRLSIQLNYRLGEFQPAGYHALNLAVHVLAGLALYGLVRRALLAPRFEGRYDAPAPYLAFAVAVLWLVHPLQTQSVTYIIQRCESMMGMFYLFTLYAWLRGATGGGRWWYTLAVASFVLCCGCKEVAATLPPVLVIFDRVFLARSWRELVRARWAAYLAVLAAWAAFLMPMVRTALGDGTSAGIGFGIGRATPWTYLLTQSEVILHYLRLSVWPRNQAVDYYDWPIARSLAEVWPAFAVVGGSLLASVALLYFRPPVGFVAFCFFAFLAPTSSVMPIVDPAFEHRMYLSLACVAIGAVFGAHAVLESTNWPARKRAVFGFGALAAAVGALVPLTFARNEVYRSHLALMEHETAARPTNARGWTSLAAMQMAAGDLAAAGASLDRADALPEQAALSGRHRAAWLAAGGRLPEAEKAYRALGIGTWFHYVIGPIVYKNAAWVLVANGKTADAVTVMRALTQLQPQVGDNWLARAAVELAAGNDAEAQTAAAEAARLDPTAAGRAAREARALVFAPESLAAALNKPRALWQARAACLADGDRDPKMLDTLAMAYAWHDRFPDAAGAARRGVAAAEAKGDADWAAALRARLRVYEAGRRYGKHGS